MNNTTALQAEDNVARAWATRTKVAEARRRLGITPDAHLLALMLMK